MKTLALDLATNIGFALGDRTGVALSGSRRLPSTGEDLGRFGRAFRDWLIIGLKRHTPERLVYESPNLHGSKTNINSLRKIYGLPFLLETIAGDEKLFKGIELCEVNSSDWISHFLGRGNIPKGSEARKKAVFRMCGIRGWRPHDWDEADALALLDYALATESAEHALKATPLFAEPVKLTAKQQRIQTLREAAGLK